ncbi:MAG: hypothetical protein ACRDA3_13105 [Peptostreptococcaceae bacterium]
MKKKDLQRCTCCGSNKDRTSNYYLSNSHMYDSNDGRLHICKDCVALTFEKYANFYGDETKALYKLTLLLDTYYSDDLAEIIYASSYRNNTSLVQEYFRKVNTMAQFKGKTSMESDLLDITKSDFDLEEFMASEKKRNLKIEEVRIKKEKESSVSGEMLRRWGKGLDEEDYLYLEDKYQELIAVYDHRSPIQRMLYENIARTQLEAENARRNGELAMYEKMMSTLSKLMGDSNLKPVQESGVNDDDASFGMFIKKIEDEEPIPEPVGEFKDVDGISTYISKWFTKHLKWVLDLDSEAFEVEEEENED